MIGLFVCMLMTFSSVCVTAVYANTYKAKPLSQPATEVNIDIHSFFFDPDNVTIVVNTIVTWTNLALEPHSVTSDNGVFSSKLLAKGQKFSFNFTAAGTYKYHCSIHPWMHGVVIVVGGGNLPPNEPTIGGPTSGKPGVVLNFTAQTSDPEGNDIQYFFDWGDGTNTGWTPVVSTGTISHQSHTWSIKGTYIISVKARDTSLAESATATLKLKMPLDLSYSMYSGHTVFQWIINLLTHIFPQFRDFIHV
jgi:plastocyanin